MIFSRDHAALSAALLALAATIAATIVGCAQAPASRPPLEDAEARLARGDALGAELAARKALAGGEERARVAAILGEAELRQRNIAEALEWLGPGQFAPSSAARGFRALGEAHMARGDLPSAGRAFDRALSYDPRSADLWVDIARLRYRGGEHRQALEAAQRALDLDPENLRALHFRGLLASDADGPMAAVRWFEAAARRDPQNMTILVDLAASLGEAGQLRRMLAVNRRIARMARDASAVHESLFLDAVLAARARKYELAATLLRRSGALAQQRPAALLLAGIVELQTGNPKSALLLFERLHQRQPDNRRVELLLARALAASGLDEELIHRFGQRAAQPEESPYLAMLVARSHEALGNRLEAARYLELAARPNRKAMAVIRVDEDRPTAAGPQGAIGAVRAALAQGRIQEARERAQRFAANHPGSADAMVLLGDSLLANGEDRAALARYQEAARIRAPWSLMRKIAFAQQRLGDGKGALRTLDRFIARNQNNFEALGLGAALGAQKGEVELALLRIKRAIALGGARDPQLLALGVALARQSEDHARAARWDAWMTELMAHTKPKR